MAFAFLKRLDHNNYGYGGFHISKPIVVGDVVHFAYTAFTAEYGSDPRTFYRTYDIGDDALSTQVQVNSAAAGNTSCPSLARDDAGRLYCGFHIGYDSASSGIEIVESIDSGATWGNRATFQTPLPGYHLKGIFTDGTAVWAVAGHRTYGHLAVMKRTGAGQWTTKIIHTGVSTAPQDIISTTPGSKEICVVKGNNVVIAVYRNMTNNSDPRYGVGCFYTNDGGTTWVHKRIQGDSYTTFNVTPGTEKIHISPNTNRIRISYQGWDLYDYDVRTAFSDNFGANWSIVGRADVWDGSYTYITTSGTATASATAVMDLRLGTMNHAFDFKDYWHWTNVEDVKESNLYKRLHYHRALGDLVGDVTYVETDDLDTTNTYSYTIGDSFQRSFFHTDDLYWLCTMYKAADGYTQLWLYKNADVGAALVEDGGGGGGVPKYFDVEPGEPI